MLHFAASLYFFTCIFIFTFLLVLISLIVFILVLRFLFFFFNDNRCHNIVVIISLSPLCICMTSHFSFCELGGGEVLFIFIGLVFPLFIGIFSDFFPLSPLYIWIVPGHFSCSDLVFFSCFLPRVLIFIPIAFSFLFSLFMNVFLFFAVRFVTVSFPVISYGHEQKGKKTIKKKYAER